MPYPFNLPELGYAYDALEPHIDARTMEIHHTKHHQAYTNNLNAALEGFESFQGYSAEQLLRGSKSLPAALQGAVQNNGGGFHNHALFWEMIAPGGADAPSGELAEAIDGAFGSFDAFKEEFTKAAATRPASETRGAGAGTAGGASKGFSNISARGRIVGATPSRCAVTMMAMVRVRYVRSRPDSVMLLPPMPRCTVSRPL